MRIIQKFIYIALISVSLICLADEKLPSSETKSSPTKPTTKEQAFAKIDSIINNSINLHVFPGCQILVLKGGKTFYDKSYGYYTYDKKQRVNDSTLYDLASLTKTTGTLLAIIKLFDEEKLKFEDKASDYLDFLKNTDKENITISEMLFHESGLSGSMFFYQNMIEKATASNSEPNAARLNSTTKQYKTGLTSKFRTDNYTLQAGDSLFLNNSFHETAMKRIAASRLGAKTYLYSCVNFILLKEIAERITGIPLDHYLDSVFYRPMGLTHIAFLPLRYFQKHQMAPTIKKDYLRNEMLQGFVHDPDAAFLGGVSGNAGLFANAHDVAAVYQMLLNGGEYNSIRFLSAATCHLFTTKTSASGRRGLGFDKPVPEQPNINPCCAAAPKEVYGHTGYTGTCCWVDPVNNLIYVFLSNRTYPDDGVNKLARLSIRPKIQEAIYKALKNN
jgi:CubicO group peptidase (beta-lactamase class C family)